MPEDADTPRIAVYSIARDEAKHAERWAKSAAAADYRLVVVDADTTDDTSKILRANGVRVVKRKWAKPFRFDVARNTALDALPDDIDVCVSLDMDEVLGDGFIDRLRDEWRVYGGFDKAMPWFNTGNWWRCDRVHTRHGWRWVSPVHEVTVWAGDGEPHVVTSEAAMMHAPDNMKPRSNYLPLLELAVREDPGNARMWTYYARQLHYEHASPDLIIAAVEHALDLRAWPTEAAFLCRIAATAAQLQWLQRGAVIAPLEAEAWYPVAKELAARGQWAEAATAAEAGAACPVASHYLTEHWMRDWGLPDQAAMAHANLMHRDDALVWGYRAWSANPTDGRLIANLEAFVREQGVHVYVVIPQKPGERDAETAAAGDAFTTQGAAVVFVDDSADTVNAKWHRAIEACARVAREGGHDRWTVIVSNNDVVIGPGVLAGLAAAVRSGPDVDGACAPNGGTFGGWLFALRGETGLNVDPQFEHWYSDTDLARQMVGRYVVAPVDAKHTHPNVATFASPELLAMARRDEARYAAKWGDDPASLYLAQHPELTGEPVTDPRLVAMPASGFNGGADAPWVSVIEDTLWVGGAPQDGSLVLPTDVASVLTLCPPEHGAYKIPVDVQWRFAPFYDTPDEPDRDVIIELARWVNERRDTGVVLVHCAGGMNRSGLVAAVSLMLRHEWSADRAIGVLRDRRSGHALFNATYERWLRALVLAQGEEPVTVS